MQRTPPSFVEILGIVWKVAFAIILIPALIVLVWVAASVFGLWSILTAILAIALAALMVSRRRR